MHNLFYRNQTNAPHTGTQSQTALPAAHSRIGQTAHTRQAKHSPKQRLLVCLSTLSLVFSLFCTQTLTVSAGIKEDNIAANRAVPVESNLIENWPTGPIVNAESAILIEANTGTILYEKNIHEKQYPASTTKILTTLIAHETCAMDELVSFSQDAVFDIDRGSNHIAIDVGEKLAMEDCIKAILIRSANEVSLAVAEHISGGDWEDFAPIMNARAKELGCLNSNFVNPNGLPNENHYTTAYDLAMIGKAFFANETLCKITLSPLLQIAASEYQPDDITEVNQMELIPRGKYAYEYLVGCKTGYTNDARSTLVSCAEKNGLKLICVVLRDEAPYQYEDTIALFEYGFSNFDKINVSQTETKYNIENTGSFYSGNDIFGSSQPLLSLNKNDCVILPKTVAFEDLTSSISYETTSENQAALITYAYNDVTLGTVSVDLAVSKDDQTPFGSSGDWTDDGSGNGTDSQTGSNPGISQDNTGNNSVSNTDNSTDSNNPDDQKQNTGQDDSKQSGTSFVFINVAKILTWVLGIAAAVLLFLIVRAFLKNYQFSQRRARRRRVARRNAAERRSAATRRSSRDSLYRESRRSPGLYVNRRSSDGLYLDNRTSAQRRRSKPTRQQLVRRSRRNSIINKFRDYD